MDGKTICIIFVVLCCEKVHTKVARNRFKQFPNAPPIPVPDPPQLLNSWIPVAIQALTYYPEMLQYEQTYMTTIAPPFVGAPLESFDSPVKPSQSTTAQTNPVSWWTSTTPRPSQSTTTRPYTTTTTTRKTHPPTTTTKWTQSTTTQHPTYTQRPTTTPWWAQTPTTTTSRPTTVRTTWPSGPSTYWTEKITKSTTTKRTTWWDGPTPPTTTTQKPITWWSPSTAKPTTTTQWWVQSDVHSPTTKPVTTWQTTTKRPFTTVNRPYNGTTQAHRPGVYAPARPWYLQFSPPDTNGYITSNDIHIVRPTSTSSAPNREFMQWFMQAKPKEINNNELDYNMNLLDPLPRRMLEIIAREKNQQPAQLDMDNVNEFRRLYDDSYAYRNSPLTGKKKVPPTKPYVEMLLLLDLLKKDAKRLGFNKYQGYGNEILKELHHMSYLSSEHQLYEILRRVYKQNEYEGTRTKERLVNLINDLGNPHSITAYKLRYVPPLMFSP